LIFSVLLKKKGETEQFKVDFSRLSFQFLVFNILSCYHSTTYFRLILVKCLSGRAKDSTIIISSWDVSPKTKAISIVKKYLLLSRHKKITCMILNYSLFTLEKNKAFGTGFI
jgi:hypothetical protein